MNKRPTLRDVSRAAEVSLFTVSRAVTGGEGVSEATRTRVLEVARELGYVPNQLARGLRGGRTRTVGILAANSTNLFYSILVASIERGLRSEGYHSLVMDAVLDGEYRHDREDAFVDDLIQHQVAGVVLTYAVAPRNVQRLLDRAIQLVFVDTPPPAGFDTVPSIESDNFSASEALGEHLVGHGYAGPWAFVGFPTSYGSRGPREAGFRAAADAAGIEIEVIEGRNDANSSYQAITSYLDTRSPSAPPRVMFAANELLLQGLLRATHERGLHVPDDVAVVAYDDFPWAQLLEPSITVVDQHI